MSFGRSLCLGRAQQGKYIATWRMGRRWVNSGQTERAALTTWSRSPCNDVLITSEAGRSSSSPRSLLQMTSSLAPEPLAPGSHYSHCPGHILSPASWLSPRSPQCPHLCQAFPCHPLGSAPGCQESAWTRGALCPLFTCYSIASAFWFLSCQPNFYCLEILLLSFLCPQT